MPSSWGLICQEGLWGALNVGLLLLDVSMTKVRSLTVCAPRWVLEYLEQLCVEYLLLSPGRTKSRGLGYVQRSLFVICASGPLLKNASFTYRRLTQQ